MAGTGDKLLTAAEIKEVTDTKVNNDFSTLTALPNGLSDTDLINVRRSGTNYKLSLGEAQHQVLADVYSKSQTDALITQSTAIPFAYDVTPGTDSFEEGGSAVILNITAPNGTIIGHLVFRPKNYSSDTGKNRAIELYNASWAPIWYIDRE